MGWALGIPDTEQYREPAKILDPNEPLEKLLLDKRFLRSFMAFADRYCLPVYMNFIYFIICCTYYNLFIM